MPPEDKTADKATDEKQNEQFANSAPERAKEFGELRSEMTSLLEVAEEQMTSEQVNRLAEIEPKYRSLKAKVEADDARRAKLDEIRSAQPGAGFDKSVHVMTKRDSADVNASELYVRSKSGDRGAREELRSAALRTTEKRTKEAGVDLSNHQQKHLERLLRSQGADLDGAWIARRLLISESDEYRSAFAKLLSGSTWLTEGEARAMDAMRAMSEGTPSAGGVGIPVLIDPTIILTSQVAAAPIVDISRVVTTTTETWKGVNSAGATWQSDQEAAEVTDNSPTLGQPTIPTYRADCFLPFSIEVGQDYPDFQGEMQRLLDSGYVDYLARKSATGSGSNEPTGIFTAMANATTNPAHVTVTTAGTLGAADIRKVYKNLPERFRQRSTWVMNVDTEEQISAFGNGLALADYNANLTEDGPPKLKGKSIVLTDSAPVFTNTTAAESALVVGDFSHYVVVQRAGMTVELVNHLFGSNRRPTGQRGWFAYARVGMDVDTPNAFRLLANS